MKKTLYVLAIVILLYLVLLIPEGKPEKLDFVNYPQFTWNRDSLWNEIEQNFKRIKQSNCGFVDVDIKSNMSEFSRLLDTIRINVFKSDDVIYDRLLESIFTNATFIGACPDSANAFALKISELRSVIKLNSISWNPNNRSARNTLYKMLYGSRAAIEEVILQAGSEHIQPLIIGVEEPSHTPVTKFLGVNIHSGDILVSRGGAPTSALISRGSDYPGNFSHIALVYVDKETNIPFIVESHIEIGVAISSLEDYIKDKKLRVMVLRPRSDLPQLIADPLLPHKAAKAAIDRAKNEHIPYDFEMDLTDNQKLFCSEVASSVYKELELDLWSFKSTISNQGTAKLLSTFGVKYFETQEPSDLEYDPQLVVVAEWRDYQTLFQDHIDNVIVDAVIEWVDKGNEISHDWYLLPFARVIKLYSGILNQFNLAGPIPEGMSATSALKHEAFNSLHEKVEKSVVIKSEQFRLKNNYVPPYWKLVSFANEYFNTDQ